MGSFVDGDCPYSDSISCKELQGENTIYVPKHRRDCERCVWGPNGREIARARLRRITGEEESDERASELPR